MTTSLLWFRRDLRLSDHPALLAARDAADEVVPVFVLDDALRGPSGANRLAFLYRNLRDLEQRTGQALRVVHGKPDHVIPRLVKECGAESVHISSDHGPYGRARDARVAEALGEIPLVATGSPYGVTPGALRKDDGTPYKVYTPFLKAWRNRGLHSPALSPGSVAWSDGGLTSTGIPRDPATDVALPEPGEEAALSRWRDFRDQDVARYQQVRDQPGTDRTSRLSPYLKYGVLHPRTLHADLGTGEGARVYGQELVWRDFYADVLWHHPTSARKDLTEALATIEYDEPGESFEAWKQGRTGYPIVDAAMRQLLAEGWMHNRARMIVASFLTKDLHVWWPHGARHFMEHLVDGDLASNQHGWQWTAGTGTDASPYFRVFNPVLQGRKFDEAGEYLRRWVPELRDLNDKAIHEPWTCEHLPTGYPDRVVDHAAERQETLDRYRRAGSSNVNEQFVDVGPVRLCYEVLGEECDPAVVLVMGLNLQMVWWRDDFCRDLVARGFRVIRFDNRDVGRSTAFPGGGITVMQFLRRKADPAYTLGDMADDVAGLIAHVAPEGAHVVGASLGSFIAQETAIRHPSRVLSLTSIMGRTGDRKNGKVALSMRAGFLRGAPADLDGQAEQMVKVFGKMGSTGRTPEDDDDVRLAVRRSASRGAGGAGQMAAILAERDRTADLSRLDVPTLVIHGDRDKIILPSGGRATAAAIPDAELLVLEGMGHDLPRRLWPTILDGIARVAQRSADRRTA